VQGNLSDEGRGICRPFFFTWGNEAKKKKIGVKRGKKTPDRRKTPFERGRREATLPETKPTHKGKEEKGSQKRGD